MLARTKCPDVIMGFCCKLNKRLRNKNQFPVKLNEHRQLEQCHLISIVFILYFSVKISSVWLVGLWILSAANSVYFNVMFQFIGQYTLNLCGILNLRQTPPNSHGTTEGSLVEYRRQRYGG